MTSIFRRLIFSVPGFSPAQHCKRAVEYDAQRCTALEARPESQVWSSVQSARCIYFFASTRPVPDKETRRTWSGNVSRLSQVSSNHQARSRRRRGNDRQFNFSPAQHSAPAYEVRTEIPSPRTEANDCLQHLLFPGSLMIRAGVYSRRMSGFCRARCAALCRPAAQLSLSQGMPACQAYSVHTSSTCPSEDRAEQ